MLLDQLGLFSAFENSSSFILYYKYSENAAGCPCDSFKWEDSLQSKVGKLKFTQIWESLEIMNKRDQITDHKRKR